MNDKENCTYRAYAQRDKVHEKCIFSATSQLSVIRFDYQRIIFRVRLVVKKNVLVFILKT